MPFVNYSAIAYTESGGYSSDQMIKLADDDD